MKFNIRESNLRHIEHGMFSVVMVLMHYGPVCVHGSVMHMVATQSEGHSGPKIGRMV